METTASSASSANYPKRGFEATGTNEANTSGVSWSAVIAGGVVSAALGLILLALGSGVGLSSVSLWSGAGASAAALSTGAILWLIFMQIVSASMGGYLAGRLRTRWTSVHTDEVYFRDTAHGFLSWAVATVATAAFLATAATSLMGSTAATAAGTSSKQSESRAAGPNDYFVDTLFRSDGAKSETEGASARSEAGIIFANALKQGDMPAQDKTYLDQMVSARTGLSSSDADKRVSDEFAGAKQAAETVRKAVAHSLLWAFLALLVGAFCASLAATIGGRQRDHVVTI